MELARELAARPRTSVAGVLRSVSSAGDLPMEEALAVERQAVRNCSQVGIRPKVSVHFQKKEKPNLIDPRESHLQQR